ncbi:hypothetical protein [Dactylosporangium sp. NPDC051541]|uniref:hypothetical protein n=1 Tax=Dactylosporangium sp. NPDC051541 TaxID=3363977 RepID=UPI003799A779
MELIALVLVPFPVGFFVRNRLAAFVTFLAVHSFVFTVQTLNELVEWIGGSGRAFGPYPRADQTEVFAYAVVNLVILLAGLGLVSLGGRLGARRRAKADGPVALEPSA